MAFMFSKRLFIPGQSGLFFHYFILWKSNVIQ